MVADDEVVVGGHWCPCVISECSILGTGVLYRATVELPDKRLIPGVHRSDRAAARMSAWWSAQRIWDATGGTP